MSENGREVVCRPSQYEAEVRKERKPGSTSYDEGQPTVFLEGKKNDPSGGREGEFGK